MLKQRVLLIAGAGGAAALVALRYGMPALRAADAHFEVMHTDAEWRALLTPAAIRRAAPAGTERPAFQPARQGKARRHLCLCRLRSSRCFRPRPSSTAAPAGRASGSRSTTPSPPRPTIARHEPHRGALPPVRRPSRPCLQRRPAANRLALLHERCCDDLHTPCRLRNRSMDKAYPVTRSDAEWRTRPDARAVPHHARARHRAAGKLRAAGMKSGRASSHAPAAASRCSSRRRSSRAAPAGRASTSRSRARRDTDGPQPMGWCAPRSIAPIAAAISATSSTTARRRPTSATASTA